MSKLISVKLNDETFKAVEKLTHDYHLSRNAYINKALTFMNKLYARRKLRNELKRESALLRADSLEVLKEFENFQHEGL